MAIEFGTGKTIFILAIVVGCFAVLWPKLFYPMLQASVSARNHIDNSQVSACCDVIFETDVNAIMIMTEMCGNILQHYDEIDPKLIQAFKQGKLTKAGSETCRNEVLNKCGVDITTFLHENVRLGKTYKQILDEIRSFNSSVCLKLNFGIAPGLLGAPHRMRVGAIHMPRHHRQERPPHLHPDMLHPALRERGRAIPQSHIIPRVVEKEGRPGPIPGMRPPMGGAGHVVPAPKGTGTMGVVMPIYTIGIVVFFMYTVMKVMAQLVVIFKKPGHSAVNYGDFSSDPDFRKMVFSEEYVDDHTNSYGDQSQQKVKHDVAPTRKTAEENGTKLGDIEIDHLRKRLEETEAAMERIVAQMGSVPHKLHSSSGTQLIGAKGEDILNEKSRKTVSAGQMEALKKEVEPKEASQKSTISSDTTQKVDDSSKHDHISDNGKPKVHVLGMEMTASCEGGHRWSRPGTPILAVTSHSRSDTPVRPLTPEPQSIYLEGALPSQSQLLVSESETQAVMVDPEDLESDTDAPVILSGKMTLSLISLDAALAAEDEQLGHKEPVLDTTLDEKQKLQELESALRDEMAPEAPAIAEEGIDEDQDGRTDFQHVNDAGHVDDLPTTTNYTTASAAEAMGQEETAADYSAMESFGTNDDQQEELEDEEEEVWNGDVDSAEDESEEEEVPAQAFPQNVQQQH
ncbi:uncharacterized protein LOC110839082 isoform X3 [Zootermopsis nevadensis]|uniref:Resistance to inhibitors of cholinesterase protein 3 N-terminal domain-containing protein n=1 Tax=Zootermopsis nevadensis TaxID=136037 RepID=A0A067QLL7_ZOONE|nr:uncharacterized protein LOC110839082 isoform X3 [Zootermopsis nevadensis]KDR08988.1 hypothetical protein L798_01380 [Zootermopsis nevadensis]